MTLREALNSHRVLKPVKIVTKAIFEMLYGLTGEDRFLSILRNHATVPVETILDVGSSSGHYLEKAARFFPKAKYYNFEPRPDAAQRLKATVQRLKISSTIYNIALADRTERTPFAVMAYGDASSLVVSDTASMSTTATIITVSTVRLDDLMDIRAEGTIGLLKIDVEGAELRVLKGARDTLARANNVQIEISPLRHIDGSAETLEVFRSLFEAGLLLVDSSESNYLLTRDLGVLAYFGKC